MSRDPKTPRAPLVPPEDAHLFASLVNRVVAGFDVAALSTAEALLLGCLLDRAIRALWLTHGHALSLLLGWPDLDPFPGNEASEEEEEEDDDGEEDDDFPF